MLYKLEREERKKMLTAGFAITLLYALHYALPLYSLSSFLNGYFTESVVSILYSVTFLITLILSVNLSKFLYRYHNYNTTINILVMDFLATMGLGFITNMYVVAILFVIHIVMAGLLFSTINIFIEQFKNKEDLKNIGSERGIFLTMLNAGILVSPLISSQLIGHVGLRPLFIVSAVCLVPIAIFLRQYFYHVKEPIYKEVSFAKIIKKIQSNKNISGVMLANFVLNSFFAIMVIYLPIYITQTIGIPMNQYLGVLMLFALIPFVILPYELGILADNKFGEKEMMIFGIIIIILSISVLPFLHTTSLFYWGLFMFISRSGAAVIEAMTYSYFYKKVHPTDISSIALFSNMGTLANITVTALAGVVLLAGGGLREIIIVYVLFALFSISKILKIKDTL